MHPAALQHAALHAAALALPTGVAVNPLHVLPRVVLNLEQSGLGPGGGGGGGGGGGTCVDLSWNLQA